MKQQKPAILRKSLLLLLLAGFLTAESGDLRFFTDYARFYDPENPYVELYYMFPRQPMARKEQAGALHGKYLVAVNIHREDENVYASSFAVDDELEPGEEVSESSYIPRIFSLHLAPGTYQVHTMLRDFYSGRVIEQVQDVNIRPFSGNSPEISDIQIASAVLETDKAGSFTKLNRYDVIPMANPEFDSTNGTFFTYFEIYGLEKGRGYTFQSSVRNLNGDVIMENETVRALAPGNFDAVIDYMDIRSLYAGTYEYHLLVSDTESGRLAEGGKRLFIVGRTDPELYRPEGFETYTQQEMDSIFQILKPLMTYPEVRSYRRGNISAKRKFFAEFWKKRDADTSTPRNEYYYDIMERIDYAEKSFSRYENGARSERGRVLLKYGYPTEVQRSGATGGTKDYEIWLYEGLRGEIKFVFCDTRGRGFYELIHSDMEGEIYNENWRAVLQSGAKNY